MSTFNGKIVEIPGISVDRFDNENLFSSVFFLSHCHTDHMVGLDHTFFMGLKQWNKYFYCSSFSKNVLEMSYNYNTDNVIQIDVNQPTYVQFATLSGDICTIRVTCITAEHCPGAVMFLFEKDSMTVLYTGDFRINPNDFQSLEFLHYREGSTLIPRKFDTVYLDTTFLNLDFAKFPTKEESIFEICQEALQWLCNDPENVVKLECSANLVPECLFIKLSQQLEQKVHVLDSMFQALCTIRELSDHITNDSSSTRLHACESKRSIHVLKCRPQIDIKNVLTIVISTQRWKGKDTSIIKEWDMGNRVNKTLNICYSMHSSFSELYEFLQYFKPSQIFACVYPDNQKHQIDLILQSIMQTYKQLDNQDHTLPIPENKQCQDPYKSKYFSDDSDDS